MTYLQFVERRMNVKVTEVGVAGIFDIVPTLPFDVNVTIYGRLVDGEREVIDCFPTCE